MGKHGARGGADDGGRVHEDASTRSEKTGRPMVLSLCQYGWGAVWRWGASVGGNSLADDGGYPGQVFASMVAIGFGQAGLSRYAGPGHWNDPDMLEVGNGGMNCGGVPDAHEPVGDVGGSAAGGE